MKGIVYRRGLRQANFAGAGTDVYGLFTTPWDYSSTPDKHPATYADDFVDPIALRHDARYGLMENQRDHDAADRIFTEEVLRSAAPLPIKAFYSVAMDGARVLQATGVIDKPSYGWDPTQQERELYEAIITGFHADVSKRGSDIRPIDALGRHVPDVSLLPERESDPFKHHEWTEYADRHNARHTRRMAVDVAITPPTSTTHGARPLDPNGVSSFPLPRWLAVDPPRRAANRTRRKRKFVVRSDPV